MSREIIECNNSTIVKTKNGFIVHFMSAKGVINDVVLSECTVGKLSRLYQETVKVECCNE